MIFWDVVGIEGSFFLPVRLSVCRSVCLSPLPPSLDLTVVFDQPFLNHSLLLRLDIMYDIMYDILGPEC